MLRQRVRVRRLPLVNVLLGAIAALLALALIWYGAMTVLLALKLSPSTVEQISAYREIYRQLVGIDAGEVSSRVRIIVAIAGVVSLVVFSLLSARALPRPYLARGELDLSDEGQRGATVVDARAIERVGELAALEHPLVTGAGARYGTDEITVLVDVRRAEALAETLTTVQKRVGDALVKHDLPRLPVNVTLTAIDRSDRRELA